MTRLGVAPKVEDFKDNSLHATDLWLKRVTDKINAISTVQAHQTVSQNLANVVLTKITFDVEDVDSHNIFSSSRFTPKVAGDYFISAAVLLDLSAAVPAAAFTLSTNIVKNGSTYVRQNVTIPIGANFMSSTATAIVSMNGSTDFIEIFALQSTGAIRPTFADSDTYFTAHLVRAS